MSNFFLLHVAIPLQDFSSCKRGLLELMSIERDSEDTFLKHNSMYNLPIYEELCMNWGPVEQTILLFLEQLSNTDVYLGTEEVFDNHYQFMTNGFLGIVFLDTTIAQAKQISNDVEYKKFNNDNLWNVTFRNLWAKRNKLFPNLILCGEVEIQLAIIGNSNQLIQIIEILKKFNEACKAWKTGNFSYKQVNQKFALTISPESDQTMSNYGGERVFSLPSGKKELFELHIKTGDFRFHFYPDNDTRKVYLGYIGTHLKTWTN